jgi:hypothetical protein
VKGDDYWDREVLLAHLHKVIEVGGGSFTLLLGGKSTGKSKLLKNMARKYSRMEGTGSPLVLLINMRETGPADLATRIFDAIIRARDRAGAKDLFIDVLKACSLEFAGDLAENMGLPGKIVKAGQKVANSKLAVTESKDCTAEKAIESFCAVAIKRNQVPCIFIDEANIAFAVETPKDKIRVQNIMNYFTALTKVCCI